MSALLPVLPVDALTQRDDRFRCDVLHADLSAGTCLGRQGASSDDPALRRFNPNVGQATRARVTRKRARFFAECANCATGRAVAQRLAIPHPAMGGCPMPGCGDGAARVIATTDPLLAPFCVRHRGQIANVRHQRKCSMAAAVAVVITGVGQSGQSSRRVREIEALRRAAEPAQ